MYCVCLIQEHWPHPGWCWAVLLRQVGGRVLGRRMGTSPQHRITVKKVWKVTRKLSLDKKETSKETRAHFDYICVMSLQCHLFLFSLAARRATQVWGQHLHVHIFCYLHHLWLLFHPEFVHWCHHWQLQSTKEKDKYLLISRGAETHLRNVDNSSQWGFSAY